MKSFWSRMGGQLGIGFCVVGFLVMFLGWNGAAGKDRVPSQFPYIISGGLAGLAIVVIGVGLIVVQNQRADRAALQATLEEIRRALDFVAAAGGAGNGQAPAPASPALANVAAEVPGPPTFTEHAALAPGEVVAGPSAYHSSECRLLEGKGPLPHLSIAAARAQGLAPCRVCDPDAPAAAPPAPETAAVPNAVDDTSEFAPTATVRRRRP